MRRKKLIQECESRPEHWTKLEREIHWDRDLAPRPSKSGPELNAAGLKNKTSSDSDKNQQDQKFEHYAESQADKENLNAESQARHLSPEK
jgi:hypothetical protein